MRSCEQPCVSVSSDRPLWYRGDLPRGAGDANQARRSHELPARTPPRAERVASHAPHARTQYQARAHRRTANCSLRSSVPPLRLPWMPTVHAGQTVATTTEELEHPGIRSRTDCANTAALKLAGRQAKVVEESSFKETTPSPRAQRGRFRRLLSSMWAGSTRRAPTMRWISWRAFRQ